MSNSAWRRHTFALGRSDQWGRSWNVTWLNRLVNWDWVKRVAKSLLRDVQLVKTTTLLGFCWLFLPNGNADGLLLLRIIKTLVGYVGNYDFKLPSRWVKSVFFNCASKAVFWFGSGLFLRGEAASFFILNRQKNTFFLDYTACKLTLFRFRCKL